MEQESRRTFTSLENFLSSRKGLPEVEPNILRREAQELFDLLVNEPGVREVAEDATTLAYVKLQNRLRHFMSPESAQIIVDEIFLEAEKMYHSCLGDK